MAKPPRLVPLSEEEQKLVSEVGSKESASACMKQSWSESSESSKASSVMPESSE